MNASLFQIYAKDGAFDKAAGHKAHIDAIMSSLLNPSKKCPCVPANNTHRVDCIASQETERCICDGDVEQCQDALDAMQRYNMKVEGPAGTVEVLFLDRA